MQQASDFLNECRNLYRLLSTMDERDLLVETKFKHWTVSDILRHLIVWDEAARLTMQSAEAFQHFFGPIPAYIEANRIRLFERKVVPEQGISLTNRWWSNCQKTAQLYATADPKIRLKWGGPDLSARTCITSRLMETWSHSQAIYDEWGIERLDHDRIRNIVQIGVQTFSWTFRNRGMNPPGPIPTLELTAPSGVLWRWHNAESAERILGSATEFCQVVTQTRNVADTQLQVEGFVGGSWMAIAQCFAGPPSDPPLPGDRRRNVSRESLNPKVLDH
ncbi:uncharacterized protein (TIGR03084 family) [Advenella incenata]|uniref:Uncharacterized protein (TIGR03084 family) n=1 Tax=Advenella incenata TaxID=267800 RepID=A0A4Q7VFW0_9BURK|nr:maleylpyruvate isomerase family mycothiol-dependent enzyme [Advenella incenata]RZT94882.1 uncharacterized protein (TIGR03084 family) [Advenella incenata]